MRRSPLTRKTPMARTSFARKLLKPSMAAKVGGTVKVWRSAKPKMTPIRKSAKDEDCTLRFIGVCNYDTDTTVWAHSNRIADGKGTGIKARDEEGCYACSACHTYLDGGWVSDKGMTFELLQAFFDTARKKSQAILRRKGLLAGTNNELGVGG